MRGKRSNFDIFLVRESQIFIDTSPHNFLIVYIINNQSGALIIDKNMCTTHLLFLVTILKSSE